MAQTLASRVRPKQSLGQNFLVDDNIAKKIVRSLDIGSDDVVLEIGPGQGALTQHLAERAKHLIAVEIDGRVVEELKSSFESQRVTILHEDFLDTDLSVWSKKFNAALRIVGNIPYHLTSPILFKIIDERTRVQDFTFMLQKEVAQRIIAKPRTKDYGILSVLTQCYGMPKRLFSVSPNCFYPKPKVTSSVVQFAPRENLPHGIDEELFKTVVKTAFGKRRKTMRNCLKYLPYDEPVIEKILKVSFPVLERRPEELTVQQFIDLAGDIQSVVL